MTSTDMGITYDAKLKEVKATVLKLEKMSIDMTQVKNTIDRIEANLSEKIQGSYDSFGKSSPVAFLYDSLTEDYRKAIKELDMLNEALKKEWESYYQIEQAYQGIEGALKKVSTNNIKVIVLSTRELLYKIKTSTTIDYKLEKDLVEKIYKLVYRVMQLEFAYSTDSILFDYVKENTVDSQFIVELIKKDLKNVEEENDQIEKLVLQLKQKGLDEKYLLDKQLLVILTLYNNPDLESTKKQKFIADVDDYLSVRSNLLQKSTEMDETEVELTELLGDHQKTSKKQNGKRIVLILNTIIVSAGILAGIVVGKELAKQKNYLTTTTVYDSSTDEQTETQDYIPGKDGSISLLEYSPWDSPGSFRKNYRRTVYRYALPPGMDSTSLQEYIKEDHQGEINYDSYGDTSETKPEDYGYVDNKYVITEVTKNLDDFQKTDRPGLWATISFLIAGGLITTDLLLFKKLSKESYRIIRNRKNSLKQEIKEKQITQEEALNELRRLASQEKSKMAQLKQTYSSLPYAVKKAPEVEAAKKKVLK